MAKWDLFGVIYGRRVGGDRAHFHRVLADGTRLIAKVRNENGRPLCDEITAVFANGARDFGRDLAISELEDAINNSDRHGTLNADGEFVPLFAFCEIPYGVPVRGSRGRPAQWTDRRLAELIRDLEDDTAGRWGLQRNTIRQRANQAVSRGLAEPAESLGGRRRWRLTDQGRHVLADRQLAGG